MSSEGMKSLMYRSEEEYFKILIVFQSIFSLSVDLSGFAYWYRDSLKCKVKVEMFTVMRYIAMRITLIIAKWESGRLMKPK